MKKGRNALLQEYRSTEPGSSCRKPTSIVDIVGAQGYHHIVKTIAVTIEEDTLTCVDRLLEDPAGPWKNRSELVRQALQEFLREVERSRQEAHETVVFRQHREHLAAQARALVAEQAEP
jgi:Arc/MetJ-type ribon-helix-helix transcriptional regulator